MLIIGVDEAGRGCLAGPVFAAAVLFPSYDESDLPKGVVVRDSKKMSRAQRDRARSFIEEQSGAFCGVGSADVACIDDINILRATHRAMHDAITVIMNTLSNDEIGSVHIYVDGDRFREYKCPRTGIIIPHTCVVRGDASVPAIAAASILAKTHRDEYVIQQMHRLHPEYGWDKNKGYGTAKHIAAIREYGTRDEIHRMTFAPCRCSFLKKN